MELYNMGTLTITSQTKTLNRIDYTLIEDEIILFLRNNLTDRKQRTLNKTETFTPDGTTTTFELTGDLDNKGRHKVMNIRNLLVDSEEKKLFVDYDCGFKLRNNLLLSANPNLGKIVFYNAPTGTSISVNYDYAYTFVYPQSNRVDLTTVDYPRVTIDTSGATEDLGIGGSSTVHTINVVITVTDTFIEGVRQMIMQLKNLFIDASVRKGFHFFNYIHLGQIQEGPNVNPEDTNDVVYEQTITLLIPNQFEFSSNCN